MSVRSASYLTQAEPDIKNSQAAFFHFSCVLAFNSRTVYDITAKREEDRCVGLLLAGQMESGVGVVTVRRQNGNDFVMLVEGLWCSLNDIGIEEGLNKGDISLVFCINNCLSFSCFAQTSDFLHCSRTIILRERYACL
jgi:hypothetical protein